MENETIEILLARHRKEARDLQNRITQRKKQATKKTRKGVNDECAAMERDMKERQEAELAVLRGNTQEQDQPAEEQDESENEDELDGVTQKLENTTISEPKEEAKEEQANGQPKQKRNRQKERLARRAAELEASAAAAEAEALLLPNWKKAERSSMLSAFATHNLTEREIRPDGHCLYSSIADQLTHQGVDIGAQNEMERSEQGWYKPIRRRAAMYILDHKDDFQDFLEEPIISYVSKIERTAEWGGHLELVALAKSYNIEINVLQDGKVDRILPEEGVEEPKKVWLAYYKHGYGLGEHYNSLRRKDVDVVEGKKEDAA